MDRVKQADYKTSMKSAAWQIAAALGLLLWRLADQPATQYWRDWMVVFAFVWIWTAVKPKSTTLPVILTTASAYLLGIYMWGNLPHALAAFGVLTSK